MPPTYVLKETDKGSPPFQPMISGLVDCYEERRVDWNPVCVTKDTLFYQFRTRADGPCVFKVLPDACLNVLFSCDEGRPEALFSGTFLEATELKLRPGTLYFGFKPYSHLGLKQPRIRLCELANNHVSFADAFPEAGWMIEQMPGVGSLDGHICLFNRFASKHIIDREYIPGFLDYFSLIIDSTGGNMHFCNIGQITGYTERYCRKRFKEHYGISPKKHSDIIRFQCALKALLTGDSGNLSAIATENGYFDQAHFIHDFRRFADTPPSKFRENVGANSSQIYNPYEPF